ncbi:MAG: hypothetical protein EHM34_00550 [Nitrosopumilales archaeon]|nr:MAG: hypothetical protein EHM34_00550 [Nitrosopumilales archaeon]
MKSLNKKLSACTPAEFDVGALINNDEIFALARRKLFPGTMLDGPLKRLVEIMIEHGNSIEAIFKIDKEIAVYAMELSNHVSGWQLQLKEQKAHFEEKYTDKEIPFEDRVREFVPEWQRKYCSGKSYEFLCEQFKLFLEKPITLEKQQSLKLARDNFESYCKKMSEEG